ncbi:MAG: hypothetical protein HZC22_05805 [Rhodocyclales bacterium]|nr:hypothetical protein [Rhodocyclales bacterium]
MHPNLSFDQAPPIGVPLRFLLTAPWFGVAAGLLLAWSGEVAVLSRWTPQALALTHLLVAGFLLQAMTGALFQFVPVAAGGNVWRPRLAAAIIHPMYIAATALLVAGFLAANGSLLRLAAGLFLPTVLLHVALVGSALLRTPARGATIAALRVAVAGLAVTVVLGASLAEGIAGSHAWPLVQVTNVHAAWGLGALVIAGTFVSLINGMMYKIVPFLCWLHLQRQAGIGGTVAWWLGALVIAGTFVSLINGMMYKIVPFLCWLHLQRQAGIGGTVPNMREIAPERAQRLQLRLHFASVTLLLLATFYAEVLVAAGAAFAASCAWLGWNLIDAVRRYQGFRNRAGAGAAGREP